MNIVEEKTGLYLEYHNLKKKFKKAESDYYDALTKRSELLYLVTPHGIQPKEIINHLSNTSGDAKFFAYASEIDEIDDLINKTRNDKDMLEYELKKKEKELRNSVNIYDRVYVYSWINKKKPREFYRLLGYSVPQTYRFISEIKQKIYENRENEKK